MTTETTETTNRLHSHDGSPNTANRSENTGSSDEPKRQRKPRRSFGVSEDEQLERIEGMLRASAMLACGVASRVKEEDAIVIARHTIAPDPRRIDPNVIAATMELCRQDKRVRAYLFGLAGQSAYLNVAVACASMAIGIMANHKLLPPLFIPPTSPKAESNGVSGVEQLHQAA